MKTIVIILLTVMLFACAGEKRATGVIIYKLPETVSQLIEIKIKDRVVIGDIYFHLSKKDSLFSIFFNSTNNSKVKALFKKSNRKVLIGKDTYPLIFDYDENFAITNSHKEILSSIQNKEFPVYSKISILYDGKSIVFNAKGKIFADKQVKPYD